MAAERNTLKESADEYLRKHRIIELMEDLCSDLCFMQPDNIETFLIEQLRLKKAQGFKTGVIARDEVVNVFTLFDLRRNGFIEKDRCKQALRTLAHNEFQFNEVDKAKIPDRVDEPKFISLCEELLGLKLS